ncbi:hypothetical protein [Gymnodinialimonas sp. 57CJ19]|uniref:hypothetical protein n=1 Tax=Gymnodinialimonas sp. 57CJ19 TaxID=3138498 RepID=UPI0031345D29
MDILAELRRPFRTRGPIGRRAMGGVAAASLFVLALVAGVGAVLSPPHGSEGWLLEPSRNGITSSIDAIRAPIWRMMSQLGTLWLWLSAVALVPLAFAMMRRAHSTGLPRGFSMALVLVAIVSGLSLILAAEGRIAFPLTRFLWFIATDSGTASVEQSVGLVIVLSPFFFATVVFDIMLMVLVGLLAVVIGTISWAACVALCFVPTRKDLSP